MTLLQFPTNNTTAAADTCSLCGKPHADAMSLGSADPSPELCYREEFGACVPESKAEAKSEAPAPAMSPYNPTTGRYYNGGNIERLADAMELNGWQDFRFATYHQWLSVGRCVIKGNKAQAFIARFVEKVETEIDKKTGEKKETKTTHPCGGSPVFNFAQTEPLGLEDKRNGKEAEQAPNGVPVEYAKDKAATPKPKAESNPLAKVDPAKLLGDADALAKKAADCHAERLTNTPKRLRQAMNKRQEGDKLLRIAAMLRGLASYLQAGGKDLPALQFCSAIQVRAACTNAAAQKIEPVQHGCNPYYTETGEWVDTSAQAEECRRFLGAIDNKETERIRAEAELRTIDAPGFFPTPQPVIDVMLEQAGSLEGKDVLEPCAGKGDIVAAALAKGATVEGFEINRRLADYCQQYVCDAIAHEDFVHYTPKEEARKDVVLMNPPFEKDQAPAFVGLALRWLVTGGRLVSVMPSNWHSKRMGERLIETMDEAGLSWHEIEIDAGSFKGRDSFKQTGVNVCLLVVNA